MTIDNINRSLAEHFAKDLPDCYDRRIIFWFDSEREFESMLDELDLTDVLPPTPAATSPMMRT